MKKIILLSIFAFNLLIFFGCNQKSLSSNSSKTDKGRSFKILFEDPQFGTLTATKADGADFSSGQLVKEDEEIIFTVHPNGEYTVKAWKGAIQDGNNPNVAHLKVKKDVEVSVKLKGKDFKVTYGVEGEGGTLTAFAVQENVGISSGKTIERGTVIFNATAKNGYKVSEWSWKGGEKKFGGYQGAPTMIMLVNSDVNVKVKFKQN